MNTDSAIQVLATMKDDTAKVILLARLSYAFALIQAEQGIEYGQQGVKISQDIGYKRGIATCYQSIAMCYWLQGNYNNGLQIALNALHLFEELNDKEQIAFTYFVIANVYRDFGDYNNALESVKKGQELYDAILMPRTIGYAIIGSIYDLQNQLDSAGKYVQKAHQLNLETDKGQWGWIYYLLGNIYRKIKLYDSAMVYYRTALPLVNKKDSIETYNGIATLYQEKGNLDSSIFYASRVLHSLSSVSYQRGLLRSANILAENYRKQNQRDSLVKYLDYSITIGNRLYSQENERGIQNLNFNERLRIDELMRQQRQYQGRLRMNAVLGIAFTLLLVLLLLWRNNRNKQKAYALLQNQKLETDTQKGKAEQALEELKITQQQLIQQEKMASLGELTAGIAHEIQNPLNFVNNFSETNKELLSEMKQAIKNRDFDEVGSIADNIEKNEEKIHHHGRRADSIVKGMLQHARPGTGQKEPANINQLAEEFLRLSYQGARSKDKSFSATINTDFDEAVGLVAVLPQDIGKVLLNLYSNAFLAVQEKKKQSTENFEPIVSVSTSRNGSTISISVKDNGIGIPEKQRSKIFQPFFTTRAPGEGTGLGLSLSFDIITKGHKGTISVKSIEREGSEFIVQLPA